MFLPENIDLSVSEKYVLNVRIKPDGFSFSIYDPKDISCYTYKETVFSNEGSLENNIQRIIFDYNFLTNNFKKTNVIWVSSKYELVPLAYFDRQKIVELFGFTHNEQISHVLLNEKKVQENELIFDMEESIYLFLRRSLCDPQFFHHSGLLINYFEKKRQVNKVNSMFVHTHDYFTDIFCFNNKSRVVYARTYVNEKEDDMIYFILNIWKSCNFRQLVDQLYVYGDFPSERMESLLDEYINNIHYLGDIEQLSDFGERTNKSPLDISILSA